MQSCWALASQRGPESRGDRKSREETPGSPQESRRRSVAPSPRRAPEVQPARAVDGVMVATLCVVAVRPAGTAELVFVLLLQEAGDARPRTPSWVSSVPKWETGAETPVTRRVVGGVGEEGRRGLLEHTEALGPAEEERPRASRWRRRRPGRRSWREKAVNWTRNGVWGALGRDRGTGPGRPAEAVSARLWDGGACWGLRLTAKSLL